MNIEIVKEKKLQPPPILRGWKATLEEREEAIKNNKMLHIYAGTSNVCDLHCIYCSTSGGQALDGEMTLEERKEVLRQAKNLGCKYVHISGAGEPTRDPLLWEQVKYINELGMIPTVFTHAKDITLEIAQKFYDMNCSVIVKIHSVKEELQDFYAGERGYTQKRSNSIDNLIRVGLNKCNPTRLGADIMITNGNKDEIPNIFRWARQNNIFPLVKSIICRERAHDKKIQEMLEISAKDVERIFYKLLQIDENEFGYTWVPTPPMATVTCDYNYYHMMVTIQGNIKPCIGFSPIGNMRDRDNALEYYWNDERMKKFRNLKENLKGTCASCKQDCYGCPCRRVARQR